MTQRSNSTMSPTKNSPTITSGGEKEIHGVSHMPDRSENNIPPFGSLGSFADF